MIKTEIKQKDLNLYLKELVWFSCKPLFIIFFSKLLLIDTSLLPLAF